MQERKPDFLTFVWGSSFDSYQISERQIPVGMPITRHPPYRSQRALLMHWAPASSIDAHAFQWIRMTDKRARQPLFGCPAHSFPCYTMFLTSATQ